MKVADGVALNQRRIASGGETGTGVGPQSAPQSAMAPLLDVPAGGGLPQRGMFPPDFVLASDRSDSNRAFRGSGMRSSTFPFAQQPTIIATPATSVGPTSAPVNEGVVPPTVGQIPTIQSFKGAWSATTYYFSGDEVAFEGLYYVAIKGNLAGVNNVNEEPDSSPTYWAATNIAAGASFQGAWSSTQYYFVNDEVFYDGVFYVALTQSNGSEPDTSPTEWQAVSSNASEFLGEWDSATNYVVGNQVTYLQDYYIAISDNINKEPDTNPSDWQQVSSSQTFLGAYNGLVSYVPGNFVTYLGNYWICISATTGNAPSTTSSFWTLLGTSSLFLGAWNSSVAYTPGFEVTFNGNYYVCLAANTNEQPDVSPSDWQQVTTSYVYLGAYSGSTQYYVGNSVTYNGSTYVCIVNSLGNTPSSTSSFWALVGTASEFTGAWNSGTAYLPANQVTFAGNYYICTAANTNEQPDVSPSFWQQISTSEVFLGTYSGSEAYVPGNQVVFNGNYWICISATTGNSPSTTSSFWTLVGTSALLIGAWSSAVAYVPGNEVTYTPSGGASSYYVALQASTNVAPTNSAYWYQIVNGTSINSAASYRPTSNPLSAVDAGSNATVTIASFTMNVSGVGAVSVSGGTISGLNYGTVYYIYYADPTISGGAVSYSYSTTKTDAITSGVDFFVGSILTPISGGAPTIGSNNGGTGAQYGFAANLFGGIATFSSFVDWTNPSNVNDGNPNSFASATINGLASNHTLKISGFSGISPTYNSIVLNVKSESVISGGTVTVAYSTDGGQTFTTIRTSTTGWTVTTDQVTLPVTQNIGALVVQLTYSTGGGSDILTLDWYEAWLVVQG